MSRPMLQRDFAELIEVSPQAVSEWVRAGRLRRGDSALVWLRAYADQLQDAAAERATDGTLAAARTRLSNEQADAQAMKNTVTRREWAPIALIDAVIGAVGRQLHAEIATIVPAVERACPQMPTGARRIVQAQVAKALERASAATIASAAHDLQDDADDE